MKSNGDLSLAGPIGQYRKEEWFRRICVIGAIPWRFPKFSAVYSNSSPLATVTASNSLSACMRKPNLEEV